MNPIVTDGQLGRLAIKHHQLFTMVMEGELPTDGVLDALQRIIDGTFPLATRTIGKEYAIWKAIRIGGVSGRALCDELLRMCECDERVLDVLTQRTFTTLPYSEEALLIILTAEDFGYEEAPEDWELFDESRLVEWSKKHLIGYKLCLCPAEVGPHLRLQYLEQPRGELLWIASKPPIDSEGTARKFVLNVRKRGFWRREAYLDAPWTKPGHNTQLDTKCVYCLRKCV